MRKTLGMIAQLFLGAVYFIFGLNGFFHFIPLPELPPDAMAFMGGIMSAPYFMFMLKITEIFGGLLLLTRQNTPFALVLLAPITLNIFLFHVFLAPAGIPIAAFMMCAHLYLGFVVYRDDFEGILQDDEELPA